MTAIAADRSARCAADPGPCLATAPQGDRFIAALFVVTILLFLIGLLALVPGA